MDLVELQNQTKQIKNPFGFTFVTQWNSKPVAIPGDGQWYSYIAGLADHIAGHLASKIHNQFHDEQVKLLKVKGDKDGARSYQVPLQMDNVIWRMITGEDLPSVNRDLANVDYSEADLSALSEEFAKVAAEVERGNQKISVSGILEAAALDAVARADQGQNLVSGTALAAQASIMDQQTTKVDLVDSQVQMNQQPQEPVQPVQEVPVQPVEVQQPPAGTDTGTPQTPAQETSQTETGAFEGLDEL